jgi:putative membrane protein
MKNTLHPNLLSKAAYVGLITLGSVALFAADQQDSTRSRNSSTTTSPSATDTAPGYNSDRSDTNRSRRNADSTSTVSRSDRNFLVKAAEHGKTEVAVSSLAAERATDPSVRTYAQRLVTEHEQANAELAALAQRKGVDLMADAKEGHEHKHIDKLNDKSGADFDKAYIKQMADAHEDVIDLFDKAAKKADDPEIAAFANKLLPTLRDHRAQAQGLEKTLKK